MQTRKWLETWVLWIAVQVVYVGMYVYKRLHLTAGLYAVFLVLAVLGLRAWKKSVATARSWSCPPRCSANWQEDGLAVSPVGLLLAAGFAIVIGLTAGVWPALRASRLAPVDALRAL